MKLRGYILLAIALLLATSLSIYVTTAGPNDDNTVDVYNITGVYDLGPPSHDIAVSVEVQFCPACNPNDAGNPGPPAFTGGWDDGRYVAVRLRDPISSGIIAGPTKIVCTPLNCPLDTLVTLHFIFTNTGLQVCNWVQAESDVYCSWCGHYYPTVVQIHIDQPPELIVTSSPPGVGNPTGSGFYLKYTYAPISCDQFVDIIPGEMRFRFDGWTTSDMTEIPDPTDPHTLVYMDKDKTVTANYIIQYYLSLETNPPGGAPGLSGEGWYDENTYAPISTDEYIDMLPGWRLRFTCWTTCHMIEISDPFDASTTVFMDKAKTVTANYVNQYYLTLDTYPSGVTTPTGEGWYDENTYAPISTDEYIDIDMTDGRRLRFSDWTTTDMIEISDPFDASTTVFMDKAKTVTANYVNQYYLTLDTYPSGLTTPSLSGEGWYDENTYAHISTDMYVDLVPGWRLRFTCWTTTDMNEIIDPSAASTGVWMDKTKTVTANYRARQCYLAVSTWPSDLTPEPVPPSGWYDEGTPVTLTAPATANYKYAPFTDYSFEWWLIDDGPINLPVIGVDPPQPNPTVVIMNKPMWALAKYHRTVPDPLGDVNIDGVTDVRDIALIAKSYGAVKGETRYSWYYDVYLDGRIDLIDLAAAAKNVNP